MAQSEVLPTWKKLIKIDIISDTVCPWCFVGKRNLDKAVDSSKDRFDFEIKWHPYFLNANASKDGVSKKQFYLQKFGTRYEQIVTRMAEVFRGMGLEYNLSGLTGSSLDSHRLVYFAGLQGFEKQHSLMEELFLGYFTMGKYIGDLDFLIESAEKVGIEGSAEFLGNPNNMTDELKAEAKKYAEDISGVPYFVLNNGKVKMSGAQSPDAFLNSFEKII